MINVPEICTANKDFLLNCVNYLLDDTDLLTLKQGFRFIYWTKKKVFENYTKTQVITIGLPP
jgi:hypothetical protein